MQRPEPASTELELDALIERLLLPDLYWHSIKCEECGVETILPEALERAREDMQQAAGALVQLRDAEALARGKIAEQTIKIEWLERMKQNYYDEAVKGWSKCRAAEAERDAAFALLRVCKDSVHPDTKIVIEALIP